MGKILFWIGIGLATYTYYEVQQDQERRAALSPAELLVEDCTRWGATYASYTRRGEADEYMRFNGDDYNLCAETVAGTEAFNQGRRDYMQRQADKAKERAAELARKEQERRAQYGLN